MTIGTSILWTAPPPTKNHSWGQVPSVVLDHTTNPETPRQQRFESERGLYTTEKLMCQQLHKICQKKFFLVFDGKKGEKKGIEKKVDPDGVAI